MSALHIPVAAAVAAILALAPLQAEAKDKGHGKGNAHNRPAVVTIHDDAPRAPRAMFFNAQAGATHCPPGLAKKNPPCIPPGQAKKGVVIGESVDLGTVHIVTRPGLYGLGDAPEGAQYAIIDNRLVRVDSRTGQILSIIRLVNAILD